MAEHLRAKSRSSIHHRLRKMTNLTITPNTTRTLTQRFMITSQSPYEVVSVLSNSVDIKTSGCFKTGDRIGFCGTNDCLEFAAGKCQSVISTVVGDGSRILTIDNVKAAVVGSTGMIYGIPNLKGMWLQLELRPKASTPNYIGPVSALAGNKTLIVDGMADVTAGSIIESEVFGSGMAVVVGTASRSSGSECVTLIGLDRSPTSGFTRSEGKFFQVRHPQPVKVLGPTAKNSNGIGVCGGLTITIDRGVSDEVSGWGTGEIGRWVLTVNGGPTKSNPAFSLAVASGKLIS